uniref:Uncharacterized protein n=1 Tax=Panagrolaimus sp. JU765 TaxID=591449 RepID=A0AC34Q1I5_9BILA
MNSGTSIDREIAEIRLALRNLHEVLHKISSKMENATGILNDKLYPFDDDVTKLAREVSHIKDNTFTVTGFFPSNATYLTAFLVLDAIIWILAFFLIFKIVQLVKQREANSLKWQEKYSIIRQTFRPLAPKGKQPVILPSSDVKTMTILDPRRPPSYRSVLIRNPPPYRRNDEEAGSLLNEIAPERRNEWTRIDD